MPATEGRRDGMVELDVQAVVLKHAQEILDREDITLDDDFFAVGGDSIVGMRFVGRVGRSVEVAVRMTLLFRLPVLRDFAVEVETLVRQVEASETRTGQ